MAEVEKVLAEGFTEAEVIRARNKLAADAIYARDSQSGMANAFGGWLAIGGTVEEILAYPETVRAITPEQAIAAVTRLPAEDQEQIGRTLLSHVEKLRACHIIVDQNERRATIALGAKLAANMAGLTLVEDEGLGLAVDDLSPALHDGEEARTRGLVLGLSLARSLLRAHGGELVMEAAPGVGARAFLSLPADRVVAI
jgi:hypothetical protein